MEPGAPVSSATGAMDSVLGKLAALLAEDSNGDVQFLRVELEKLHALLKNMSEVEDPGEQGRRWLKEVREFSYDVDDCLDDSMLSADNGSGSKLEDGLAEKIKIWSRETTAHRRIGEEISASSISEPSMGAEDPRDYKEMPEGELVGIDGPSAELIEMLDISVQQPKVVSIVGCGGLGKTALARHVYHTLGEQFDCRAFVSVFRKHDLVTILRDILGQLGCEL